MRQPHETLTMRIQAMLRKLGSLRITIQFDNELAQCFRILSAEGLETQVGLSLPAVVCACPREYDIVRICQTSMSTPKLSAALIDSLL